MALTDFQNELLRLLAKNRMANPESYVAGGLAPNHRLGTPRLSRDIDIFHDSREAMLRRWEMDRATLQDCGCTVTPMRELKYFIEAEVEKDGHRMEIQWGTTRRSRRRWRPASSSSTRAGSAAPGRRSYPRNAEDTLPLHL